MPDFERIREIVAAVEAEPDEVDPDDDPDAIVKAINDR